MAQKSLMESIGMILEGKTEEKPVDKAHFCATHVEHTTYGMGVCISEEHAEPDAEGNIEWYTVQFEGKDPMQVMTAEMKILQAEGHMHSGKKKKMAEENSVEEESHQSTTTMKHIPNASPALKKAAKDIKPGVAGYRDRVDMLKAGGVKEAKLHPNQQKLDVHEPEKDELTANDFKMLRAGKKAKMKTEASDPENILPKDAAAPVSKSPNDKEKKSAMANQVSTQKQGKGGMDAAKVSSVKEASTGNAFDWKNTPSQLKTKPGEKAGFDSKKIPTGTVYTRKPPKPVKENITQTIINHDDFVLEVTDNPTYGDYLKALQSMINTTSEDVQQELINVAEEAFNNKVDSIIIESKSRATFKAKLDELRKSGAKVLDENYMVDSGEPYVEYVVDKDGVLTQYVHVGTVNKS
jgi:hypothetical protein